MVTSIQDPAITILDLLDTNWNTANTSISSKPRISTGWWDNSNDLPQLSIIGDDMSPFQGGETGFTGIEGDGSGPMVTETGTLQVHCWATRGEEEGSPNPKKLTYEFSEEVKRIVISNTFNNTDLNYISWKGRRKNPALTESPVVYRVICTLGFAYDVHP